MAPNFRIIECTDRYMRFVADHIDVGVINAIRRVIMSEIDNVAIAFDPYNEDNTDIKFIENTSSLHNEFLGHRISLIPIQVEPSEIKTFDSNKYSFVIHKSNTTKDSIDITTDDIEVFDEAGNKLPKEVHDKIFPHDNITGEPILITKLKPNLYNQTMGEKLHVEFKARTGKATQHARWSPVSTCTYMNVVDDEAAKKAFEEKASTMNPNERAVAWKRFNVHDRYRYFVKNQYDEPDSFEFTIESECRWTPKMLVSEAIDVLVMKMQSLKNSSRCKVETINEATYTYAVIIDHEDHTLGNLLQTLIYNEYIRENNNTMLSYVGYYQPHPLNTEVVFKFVFKEKTDALDFLRHAIEGPLTKTLHDIKKAWETVESTKTRRDEKKTEGKVTKDKVVKRVPKRIKKDESN